MQWLGRKENRLLHHGLVGGLGGQAYIDRLTWKVTLPLIEYNMKYTFTARPDMTTWENDEGCGCFVKPAIYLSNCDSLKKECCYAGDYQKCAVL